MSGSRDGQERGEVRRVWGGAPRWCRRSTRAVRCVALPVCGAACVGVGAAFAFTGQTAAFQPLHIREVYTGLWLLVWTVSLEGISSLWHQL